ncbi:MAG: hypothetical protein JWQ72_541 [Polaromonas sp.]|nr:hypothetical protein [Polaromonas sp.]
MFSEHLHKADRPSYRPVWLAAGAVAIVCQMGAMAMVAEGQVKKAALRESELTSQRIAVAQCFENNLGPARKDCVSQASTTRNPSLPVNQMADSSGVDTRPAGAQAQGLMPVSFGAR